jgi:hypothetical protein
LVRFVPDIVKIYAHDASQMIAVIAMDVFAMAGTNTFQKILDHISTRYAFTANRADDPVRQFAAFCYYQINTEASALAIFQDACQISTVGALQQRAVKRARRGNNKGLDPSTPFDAILIQTELTGRIRSFLDARFIGTAQNIAAPGGGLNVLLGQ